MKVVSATNVGNYRKNNEDCYFVNESKNLYILADGMGRHLAGERASKMATEIMASGFEKAKEILEKLDSLSDELFIAMDNEEFEKCHDIQMKIDDLELKLQEYREKCYE